MHSFIMWEGSYDMYSLIVTVSVELRAVVTTTLEVSLAVLYHVVY